MRLLIDECVDERLRLLFAGHECQTARFANLAGLKNGRLLEAAEAMGFDVLITVDQNIPDQQNLSQRKIAMVILRGRTNRLRDLELLVPAAISALGSVRAGEVVKDPVTAALCAARDIIQTRAILPSGRILSWTSDRND